MTDWADRPLEPACAGRSGHAPPGVVTNDTFISVSSAPLYLRQQRNAGSGGHSSAKRVKTDGHSGSNSHNDPAESAAEQAAMRAALAPPQ